MSIRDWYEMASAECGIKVGDRVTVTCEVPSRHNGWQNSWCGGMNRYVGNTYYVQEPDYNRGFLLGESNPLVYGYTPGSYKFPFYVLEVVEKAPEPTVQKMSFWNYEENGARQRPNPTALEIEEMLAGTQPFRVTATQQTPHDD